MPDFWRSSGYRLLAHGPGGVLRVTDEFLRSYLVGPGMVPVPQSCADEMALHDALLADPRRAVGAAALEALADADARQNYAVWLSFRDRLVTSDSLESAYVGLFRGDGVGVPPSFVARLTQAILRHVLGEDADPFAVRASEMLYRSQTIAVADDGAVTASDELTVDDFAGSRGPLPETEWKQRAPARAVDLDVLDAGNAASYWTRDERYDMSIRLDAGGAAVTALARVMERWIAHFLAVDVSIRTEREIDAAHWMWHVGLDAEASALLNDLYNRGKLDAARMRRWLCLFRLDFANPANARPALAGQPVWMAMAMDDRNHLRLKPQNLLLNLPLSHIQ